MKLLTKAICNKTPMLYSQEKVANPMVVAKFFTPDSNWTWYVIEASKVLLRDGIVEHFPMTEYQEGDDVLFFGLVQGFETELGYWYLSDFDGVKGPLGLPIERDLHWKPTSLQEVG